MFPIFNKTPRKPRKLLKHIHCIYNYIMNTQDNNDKLADQLEFDTLETTFLDLNNTKKYIPYIHYGKVIKVYDGDTITIAAQLYNGAVIPKKEMYRFSVRLNGIDTPEIKTSNLAEHTLAIIARDALSKLVIGKVVRLTNISYDKYGRLLSTVFLEDIDLCKWMLEHNYAVVYHGGHKVEAWD